jgi:hypothetical protein
MWKIVGIIALAAVLVVGGTLGFLYSQKAGDLNKTKTTLADTQATLSSTQSELSTTKTTLTSTQDNLRSTENTLTLTKSQLKATTDNLTAKAEELVSKSNELSLTKGTLTSTQSELSSTKSSLTSTTQQLTAIQSKYPLKNFPTVAALRTWLATEPLTSFSPEHCLDLQIAAMNDGWLISTNIDSLSNRLYIGVIAILDTGDVYIFSCDEHSVLYITNIYQ